MSLYQPNPPPFGTDVESLRQWMVAELNRIARCQTEADDKIALKVRYAAPVKYAEGDCVLADGTSWNPGSGAGAYRRSATAWVFLG